MSKQKSAMVADSSKVKIAANAPWLHSSSGEDKDIDWEKCFLCQDDLAESLQSSVGARSVDPQQSYNDLAEHVIQFKEINMLPMLVNIGKLAESEELGNSLFKHGAKSHKMCKLKFGKEKLNKVKCKHKKLDEDISCHTNTLPAKFFMYI